MKAVPEFLGSFYLGAEYDLKTRQPAATTLNYDTRQTTHVICVGMTGSGKTGLGIDMMEEAAIDGLPAILIDPKGDIANLLLQFPQLRPEDFLPWIEADEARRAGKTPEELARGLADQWRGAMTTWGISPARFAMLQNGVELDIYTPGSSAGIPVNILGSLAAPKLDFDQEAEIIRERIGGTVTALLSLVGVEADPFKDREAILLSHIFEHFWRAGQDLDLKQLILSIQNPPVRQFGVLDLDTFYPQKERFELAMAFNNLVAAPGFQGWLQGDPLDIDALLYTDQGKPRHSIFYLAHLSSEAERMFFVTLLLESLVTWMRGQTGTSSLRALLYFDEVFGYFPPVAEPPSKRPLLTLLKQGRAAGLGCILATQNPADLDYKGLTNSGTWFIGKLQAERDKDRVLEGLRGAIAASGGSVAAADYGALVGQLGNRVFLMHNVYEEQPVVFQTRWTMSYLRGPLTRAQVQRLMEARKAPSPPAPPPELGEGSSPLPRSGEGLGVRAVGGQRSVVSGRPSLRRASLSAAGLPEAFSTTTPVLDPGVRQVYLPVTVGQDEAIRQLIQESEPDAAVQGAQLVYEPAILGGAIVNYLDNKRSISQQEESALLVPAPDTVGRVNWGEAEALSMRLGDVATGPARLEAGQGPYFAPVPETANSPKEINALTKSLADWLFYNRRLSISIHPELGVLKRPGQSEREFKVQLSQAARERRDAEVEALKQKYSTQIDKLQTKLRKYERDLEASEADYDARKREELITTGETVLGFLMGRRYMRTMSRVATKRRLATHAKYGVEEKKDEIADLEEEITRLSDELEQASAEITRKWSDTLDQVSSQEVAPRRGDIDVRLVALAWVPSWRVTYREGGQSGLTATIAAYPMPER
jgi:phage host-nuclease inhibitor protein Gam